MLIILRLNRRMVIQRLPKMGKTQTAVKPETEAETAAEVKLKMKTMVDPKMAHREMMAKPIRMILWTIPEKISRAEILLFLDKRTQKTVAGCNRFFDACFLLGTELLLDIPDFCCVSLLGGVPSLICHLGIYGILHS